jgi:hypothetical protein
VAAGPPVASLYDENHPARFWRIVSQPEPSPPAWAAAIRAAAVELPEAARAAGDSWQSLLAQTLGEGQFGDRHWRLSAAKRLYYILKPLVPRRVTRTLRRASRAPANTDFPLDWPAETRYARFQWAIVGHLLAGPQQPNFRVIHFWPDDRQFALVLTHDVETAGGQAFVRAVADLEASYGFRSSFNFVPDRYPVDRQLLGELRERGFEIGVHGLKHDGKLFRSYAEFMRRAERINHYGRDFGAVGFRAPLTHRNPLWMQALDVDYDLSFFDTDPFEPIPGGTMSLWPFIMGRFVELPYTLVQDYTLTEVLQETTARVWLEKVEVIQAYSGMALALTHPDYLRSDTTWRVYDDFLRAMSRRGDYWHALPRDVARWWRARMVATSAATLPGAVERTIGEPAGPDRVPVATRPANAQRSK